MYIVPLYEVGITKLWHAVCLAVTAAGPSNRVWLMSSDCKTKRFYGGTGQLLSPRCLHPWTANQDCGLICDEDNCRIVAVNFSCDESRVLATDTAHPSGIAVDTASRSLFTGEWGGHKCVMTYKF